MSSLDLTVVAAEMSKAGVIVAEPDQLRTDGVLCRFSTNAHDKYRRRRDGWAVIFADGPRPVVAFGDWSRGISESIVIGGGTRLSPAERERQRIAVEQSKATRAYELRRRHAFAAVDAVRMWSQAGEASADHPYLARKGVDAKGVRDYRGAILVPMHDSKGSILNLQRIRADGQKRFLRGGRVSGLYASIGTAGEHILLCEGWATGKSLNAVTALPVAVAFSSGNLYSVAVELRRKYPSVKITVCADNDAKPDGSNPGVKAATAAAMAVAGHLAIPPTIGDFNDFIAANGGLDNPIEVLPSERFT